MRVDQRRPSWIEDLDDVAEALTHSRDRERFSIGHGAGS